MDCDQRLIDTWIDSHERPWYYDNGVRLLLLRDQCKAMIRRCQSTISSIREQLGRETYEEAIKCIKRDYNDHDSKNM